MTLSILICLIIAAIFGLILISFVLTNKRPPRAVIILHGLFAAASLVLLIIYSYQHMVPQVIAVTAIFIIVALLGFFMAKLDITGKKLPKPIAVIHGAVAACTLLYLIYFFTGRV